MTRHTQFEQIEAEIRSNAHLHEQEKLKMLKNIQQMRNQKVNMLITGATGCGKSSTINALFGEEVTTVGVGVAPETMSIEKYILGGLTIWDSPGLGDGVENDKLHAQKIINLLQKTDDNGNTLIDMVLLILDGSQKDYGTSYELLTKVLIPYLGEERKERILVAINQADQAKKGRGWDHIYNQPTPGLLSFLNEKIHSTQTRIKASTGVDIEPVYYSAGYKDEGEQQNPYNLSKLLYFIIKHTPAEKAPVLVVESNSDKEVWGVRDEDIIYQDKIRTGMLGNIISGAATGSKLGAKIGSRFGPVGATVCGVVGGVLGGIVGGLFG